MSNITSKRRHKRQKMYNMKGCNKSKKQRGGTSLPLAYTGEQVKLPHNPNLAFTGAGAGPNAELAAAYPNRGPPILPTGTPIWAPSGPQRGGCNSCGMRGGCNSCGMRGGCNSCGMTGGGCGCAAPLMNGGAGCPVCTDSVNVLSGGRKHRVSRRKKMKGGAPYPNGLVGSALNPAEIQTWPGVDVIPGNSNYYAVNPYNNDISRQMQAVGANPPFLKGGRKHRRNKSRKQKGGNQILPDTLVNAARYVPYTIGSIYNQALGYDKPTSPFPTDGQFPNSNNTLMKLSRI